MTKAEARLIETLSNDAWIALAYSDGVGASAIVKDIKAEVEFQLGEADREKIQAHLAHLHSLVSEAAQIVSRIRQAALEELK